MRLDLLCFYDNGGHVPWHTMYEAHHPSGGWRRDKQRPAHNTLCRHQHKHPSAHKQTHARERQAHSGAAVSLGGGGMRDEVKGPPDGATLFVLGAERRLVRKRYGFWLSAATS